MFEIDNEETSGDESDTGSSEPPKKPKKEASWGVLSFTKAKNGDRIPLLPQQPVDGTEGLLPGCKKLIRSIVNLRYGASHTIISITINTNNTNTILLEDVTGNSKAPWTKLADANKGPKLIDPTFLPDRLLLSDPDKMPKENVIKIYDWWLKRQKAGKVAFRFSDVVLEVDAEDRRKREVNLGKSNGDDDKEDAMLIWKRSSKMKEDDNDKGRDGRRVKGSKGQKGHKAATFLMEKGHLRRIHLTGMRMLNLHQVLLHISVLQTEEVHSGVHCAKS